ncbi:ABC-F type ribosomal protection protein [Paenibacillus sp. IB182496]|uniref:ABC-F type ribosomal protection protein n=1 Tax=Paenibacillus sabuli TaxID=2772509 RepID=A0A927BRG2_9BACL|nr:ABC-F type ribosomal protection protein [Paenibacillus sabuli]MBD2845396.1 ABC-F type ribosomal protection protein [Paenibacillus sabuli]
MALIQVQDLSFTYEGSYDIIFDKVSFQLDTQWKLGFTGRNGRGKTTFLRLLRGEHAYSGTIAASVAFDYFPYTVQDPSMLTMHAVETVCPDYEHWQLVRELTLMEAGEELLYRPFDALSGGEQTKVMLAAMFLNDNRFLLIDEPTNHLDRRGRDVLGRYLDGKRGYILVSHDRAFLDRCVDHMLSINKTNIEVQRGNFSSWWANKTRQDQYELAENDKLRKDIKRLDQAARRTGQWSDEVERSKNGTRNSGSKVDKGYVGHKAAKMMKRSKSMQQRQASAIAEKGELLKNVERAESLKLNQLKHHKAQLVQLREVAVRYGEHAVCRDVSFTVEQGERIALSGPNGSGKSSLLRLICGEAVAHEGEMERASGLKIAYVPQDTSQLRGGLSAYAQRRALDESQFKAILRKLDFARAQFDKDMDAFSAGQKKKVLLAASLCEEAHLHVWDEPLNYIDVFSRIQIEELLLEHRPTLLFVEHDAAFCERMATMRVVL